MSNENEGGKLLSKDELQSLRDLENKDLYLEINQFFEENEESIVGSINEYLNGDGVKAQAIFIDHLMTACFFKAVNDHLARRHAIFRKHYGMRFIQYFVDSGYEITKEGQLVLD